MKDAKVLVVDDDEVMRQLLREVLAKEGYLVTLAPSGEAAVKAIRSELFQVVLSDIRMLELDGIGVLREVKARNKASSVILMTGFGSMVGALEAIQEGAFDYVSKPFKLEEIKSLVARGVKHWESVQDYAAAVPDGGQIQTANSALLGKSPKIVEVYKIVARAALSQSNVLLRGEVGTGKELVARAIHENSGRRDRRFVTVSSEGWIDSEVEGVRGGTLFIDEVADFSLALQTKLLKILQESGVRAVAATQRDLEPLVKQGKFREELYYSLKVIQIDLPPLRMRVEDIPELVDLFLRLYTEKNGKRVSHVSKETLQALKDYAWPGNVRELEHLIERAVAMTSATVLFPEDFPLEIRDRSAPQRLSAPGEASSLEDLEKSHILRVLQEAQYNKSKAAEVLGIDRATLYRKAQRFGIELKGK